MGPSSKGTWTWSGIILIVRLVILRAGLRALIRDGDRTRDGSLLVVSLSIASFSCSDLSGKSSTAAVSILDNAADAAVSQAPHAAHAAHAPLPSWPFACESPSLLIGS